MIGIIYITRLYLKPLVLQGLHKNSLCDHLPCLQFFLAMHSNAVILLQKMVMVSPGTHPAKNH